MFVSQRRHDRRPQARSLFDRGIVVRAIGDSFKKLDPRWQVRNPVMFVVEVAAVATSIFFVRDLVRHTGNAGFDFAIAAWLWFTVLFANFAEAVAEGRGISRKQSEVRWQGCAIECRINAEDAGNDFRPAPGRVRTAIWPSGDGVRVDTHIVSGATIPPFYDSLLAKIIAYGADRASVLERLRAAISQTRIEGVANNLSFHADVLADREFLAGGVDTSYLPRLLERRRFNQESVIGA